MCGIAGVHRLGDQHVPDLDRFANELLLAIEHRGTHATGYVAMHDTGKVQLEKLVLPARKFIAQRDGINEAARTVLLHTRFRTTGTPGVIDAHPHASGSVAAVHNGTIWNADEIFAVFGLKRRANVDSEVIPAVVNYAGWEQLEDAFGLLEGGAATALVDTKHPHELALVCLRHYPLVYTVVDDLLIFASEARSIQDAWRRTYGTKLQSAMIEMVQGDVVRANGVVETGRIPGVPYPERERTVALPKVWRPIQPVGSGPGKKRKRDMPVLPPSSRTRTQTQYTFAEIDAMLDDVEEREPCFECGVSVPPRELDLDPYGRCTDCVVGLPLWDRDYLTDREYGL